MSPFLAAQAGRLFKFSDSIWMLNNHPGENDFRAFGSLESAAGNQ
jgi:hypothetical protein